jgi:hypothetical protein
VVGHCGDEFVSLVGDSTRVGGVHGRPVGHT